MMTDMDSNGAILESMEISSLNKLPPHTPLSHDKQLLNGDWEFVGYDDVEEIPWPQLFDVQMPRTMPVPANWELHGFGSPRYINTRYTFEPDADLLHPPYIPAGRNPVGIYARTFTHQAEAGFRDILAFNGFEGALFVYLNQQFVGYASNGRSVSEFDITELAHSGENQLHLVLAAFSAGSWLECQDMWRLKGINRDVYLTRVPERRIFDHYTHFDPDRSRLHIDAKILNVTPILSDPLYLSASIQDPQGKTLRLTDDESRGFTGNLSPHYEEKRFAVAPESLQANTMGTIYLDLAIPTARLWSPEHPHLYTITLTLRDTAGHTLDSTCYPFGLRSIETRGPELLLNGASIKLRGVNHHEFHPDSGHVITVADMERDIRLMKQNNINAVRSAHYTHDPAWYELCDRYGLLVMDEANAESHGISYRRNILPGNDPRWLPHYMERIRAMVQTNKNHSSIFCWSLGNEIGFGDTIALAAAYCRTADPTRLIHKRQMNRIADMDSETYPSVADMIRHAEAHPDRPFVTNEYAHAMGNAMGNLAEYWEAILQHKPLIGGFVWEWCDHGLRVDGKLTYGGDHGEAFHDGNFCIDGIVTPDREPTPKLAELKQVHQQLRFSLVTPTTTSPRIRLTNDYAFTDLSHFTLSWQLLADGHPLASGTLDDLTCAPQESCELTLPCTVDSSFISGEILLDLSLRLKHSAPWAQAGHELAYTQLPLPSSATQAPPAELAHPSSLHSGSTAENLTLTIADVELHLARTTGLLTRYAQTHDSGPGIRDLRFQIWRAPSDNDRFSSYNLGRSGWPGQPDASVVPSWHGSGLDRLEPQLLQLEHDSARIRTQHRYQAPDNAAGFFVTTIYHLLIDGALLVETLTEPFGDLPPLPRLGLVATLDASYTDYSWYGLGPHETYPDRRLARKALHARQTTDNLAPYIKPQTCGNHESSTWLRISNGRNSYSFRSHQASSMSALPYSDLTLSQASHREALPSSTGAYVSLDARQSGLGNKSCGPETLPQYLIQPQPGHFIFSLHPGGQAEAMRADISDLLELSEQITEHSGPRSEAPAERSSYQDPSDPDARAAIGMEP